MLLFFQNYGKVTENQIFISKFEVDNDYITTHQDVRMLGEVQSFQKKAFEANQSKRTPPLIRFCHSWVFQIFQPIKNSRFSPMTPKKKFFNVVISLKK